MGWIRSGVSISPPICVGMYSTEKLRNMSSRSSTESPSPSQSRRLGGVPAWVGEADLGVREPDDSRGDPHRRVGREAHDHLASEVVHRLHVVESWQPVDASRARRPRTAATLTRSRAVFSGITTSCGLRATSWSGSTRGLPSLSNSYPKRAQGRNVCVYVAGPEVGERGVGHVYARRPVLVDVDLVLAAERAFLDWFGVLRAARQIRGRP